MNSLEKYYEDPERYQKKVMPNFEIKVSISKNDVCLWLFWSKEDHDSASIVMSKLIDTDWEVNVSSDSEVAGAIAMGCDVLRLSSWPIHKIELKYQEKHVKIHGKPDPDYPPLVGSAINREYC